MIERLDLSGKLRAFRAVPAAVFAVLLAFHIRALGGAAPHVLSRGYLAILLVTELAFLPACLVAVLTAWLSAHARPKDARKALRRAFPAATAVVAALVGAYAGSIGVPFLLAVRAASEGRGPAVFPLETFQFFSAALLPFQAGAFLVCQWAIGLDVGALGVRCAKGHLFGTLRPFCPTCGLPPANMVKSGSSGV